jgi:hypothetical protein
MDEAEKIEPEHPEIANIPPDQKSDVEVARLCGAILRRATKEFGLAYSIDAPDANLDAICDAIIRAAGDRAVDPVTYRVAWLLRFGSETRH